MLEALALRRRVSPPFLPAQADSSHPGPQSASLLTWASGPEILEGPQWPELAGPPSPGLLQEGDPAAVGPPGCTALG